jgi:hypothetical protein
VARIKLILRIAVGTLAFLLYVWVAAVRLAPKAKRRKALRRRARRGTAQTEPLQARQGNETKAS